LLCGQSTYVRSYANRSIDHDCEANPITNPANPANPIANPANPGIWTNPDFRKFAGSNLILDTFNCWINRSVFLDKIILDKILDTYVYVPAVRTHIHTSRTCSLLAISYWLYRLCASFLTSYMCAPSSTCLLRQTRLRSLSKQRT
jgi:hypothetical protein